MPLSSPAVKRMRDGDAVRTIRIIVADDQAIVRRGIASLLSLTPEFEVVGEAENGIEAVEMARRLRPDVLFMDVEMPLLNGIDAVRKVKSSVKTTKIIMLSSYDTEEVVMKSIATGADGYMLKNATPEMLSRAVHAAASGAHQFYSPSFSEEMIDALRAKLAQTYRQGSDLTPREREVLQLIAEGRSHQEIADLLHVSVRTVDTHRNNLMQKLKIHDTVTLVRYAVKAGLTRI